LIIATTALMRASVLALEALGVLGSFAGRTRRRLRRSASPMRRRACFGRRKTRFEAEEIGMAAFAHNIENRHLVARWKRARAPAAGPSDREENAQAVEAAEIPSMVLVQRAPLVLRHSLSARTVRARSAGAAAGNRDVVSQYPQQALTFNIRPHAPASRYLDGVSYRKADPSRWFRCRACARASSASSIRLKRSGCRVSMRPRWRVKSNPGRIRISAKSRSIPAAARSR
jgi:hypothetical protein